MGFKEASSGTSFPDLEVDLSNQSVIHKKMFFDFPHSDTTPVFQTLINFCFFFGFQVTLFSYYVVPDSNGSIQLPLILIIVNYL